MPRARNSLVRFVLFFREQPRHLHALSRHARRVSDTGHSLYGSFLTRPEIARLVSPSARRLDRCRKWFNRRGMPLQPTGHPQIFWAAASLTTVRGVFGSDVDAWLEDRGASRRSAWPLPESIASSLKDFSATRLESGQLARAMKGMDAPRGADRVASSARMPGGGSRAGATPADVGALYAFPSRWTGRGETIALLNLGAPVRNADLVAFWSRHGIERSLPQLVNFPGARFRRAENSGMLARLEPTMGAAWSGAMAPGAEIVIFNVDTSVISDPWVAFLSGALESGGRARPTILVSTWSLPERVYNARHGRTVFGDLLEQAAAAGITYIAASGDWGAYDGRPTVRIHDEAVADAPWPHGVFPSVEDYVLSVGGTMVTATDPLTELGWSGPMPPNAQLRSAMPFHRMASSGGFSEDVPIPWWQLSTLQPNAVPRYFRRGSHLPAVVPSGRGYPDVALMAQGAAVVESAEWGLSSVGYEAVVDGELINWAGGTSLAAPIWAAIVARMNEARAASQQPRVGFVNPLLYRLAAAKTTRDVFRPVTIGASDIELKVLDGGGRPSTQTLNGYQAGPGWNPVTGLGVPVVSALIDASLRSASRPAATRRRR